jgi:hypothetical protein
MAPRLSLPSEQSSRRTIELPFLPSLPPYPSLPPCLPSYFVLCPRVSNGANQGLEPAKLVDGLPVHMQPVQKGRMEGSLSAIVIIIAYLIPQS